MKTTHSYCYWLVLIIFSFIPVSLLAKSTDCGEKITEYLDEKVVFCVSKSSLMQYRSAAKVFDLEAMNELVFSGECNFIPDGEYLPLKHYSYHLVDSVSFIAIKIEDITIWSLAELVSEEGTGRNQVGGSNAMVTALADTGFSTVHCP